MNNLNTFDLDDFINRLLKDNDSLRDIIESSKTKIKKYEEEIKSSRINYQIKIYLVIIVFFVIGYYIGLISQF